MFLQDVYLQKIKDIFLITEDNTEILGVRD